MVGGEGLLKLAIQSGAATLCHCHSGYPVDVTEVDLIETCYQGGGSVIPPATLFHTPLNAQP